MMSRRSQILKKYYKEKQPIDIDLYVENNEILTYFNHFRERLSDRFGGELISYENYWDAWIVYFRGYFVSDNDDIMYRMLGSHVKGQTVYKLVYKKIRNLNIYVPLTIFEIKEHKKAHIMYVTYIKNKK